MNKRRGNWYLLTGLLIGLVLGLFFAWVISPVQYVDISPSDLPGSQKDLYRRVIALAYQVDRDLDRARQRAELIDSRDPVQSLAAQAQRMLAEGQSAQDARALAILAADLGRPGVVSAVTEMPSANPPIIQTTTVAEQRITATQEDFSAIQPPPRW